MTAAPSMAEVLLRHGHAEWTEFDAQVVAQALAAAGFGHVASELQEVLLAALGKSAPTDTMKAYLLDAADRLGDPSHRGNQHAWPEHARMMRALAAALDGEGGR